MIVIYMLTRGVLSCNVQVSRVGQLSLKSKKKEENAKKKEARKKKAASEDEIPKPAGLKRGLAKSSVEEDAAGTVEEPQASPAKSTKSKPSRSSSPAKPHPVCKALQTKISDNAMCRLPGSLHPHSGCCFK